MEANNCRTLVFSSTSTIYGEPTAFPLVESMPPDPIHPYAQSKLAVEHMLAALSHTLASCSVALFQPRGCSSQRSHRRRPIWTSEQPFPLHHTSRQRPPRQAEDLWERLPDTRRHWNSRLLARDGSGRSTHGGARLPITSPEPASITVNIGTGHGLSVLDVVRGFEKATSLTIPYEIVARRPGDVPRLEGCPKRAAQILGWRAKRGLEEMCRDGWAWQANNPEGYHRR